MVRVVTKPWGFEMDIVRVSEKLKAFREDFPATEYGLIQSFTEDDVGGVARVIGWCSSGARHPGVAPTGTRCPGR